MPTLTANPGWNELKAVRGCGVYLTDGNAYFNRPGPRIVESLEILAAAMDHLPPAPAEKVPAGKVYSAVDLRAALYFDLQPKPLPPRPRSRRPRSPSRPGSSSTATP